MKRSIEGALILMIIALFSYSGPTLAVPMNFRLTGQDPVKGFTDNVISVLTYDGQHLWAGTGGGVTRSIGDPTFQENWLTYTRDHGLCGNGLSAIAVRTTGEAWTASAGDTVIAEEETPYGMGLSHAHPPYENWACQDPPGETDVFNVTYDIAINGDTLWIASYGGGCLSQPYTGLWRSTDGGEIWERVTLDYSPIIPADPKGHVAFSVLAWENWVWAGTANGIYTSTDAGSTWVNHNHENAGLSGNFVIALAAQHLGDDLLIWAGTNTTGPGEINAISVSADTGKTWQVFLAGYVRDGAYNFAFQDTVVWAATKAGLFRSTDLGTTWSHFTTNEGLPSSEVFSLAIIDSTVFAGTLDGLAFTSDDGETWDFLRFSAPTAYLDKIRTYAYPNPFSPNREELGVKIRYSLQADAIVNIQIFDWALDLVRSIDVGLVQPEEGDQELLEFWDGRNENGQVVANGVYFYRIKTDQGSQALGKIVVLD